LRQLKNNNSGRGRSKKKKKKDFKIEKNKTEMSMNKIVSGCTEKTSRKNPTKHTIRGSK